MAEVCTGQRFLCLLLVLAAVIAKDPTSLFSVNDNIIVLDNKTINDTIHKSDTFLMVNFYSSWCGHCHHFAPIYKSLATDIKEWAPVVQLAAIDCAVAENHEACKDYKVEGYPTIKNFYPHTPDTFLGDIYGRQTGDKTLRLDLLKYVYTQINERNLTAFRKLQPLRTLEDIWHDVKPSVAHTVVVFEREDSFVGMQVILDFWSYKQVIIRRMASKDVTQYGITKFPSVYLIEKGGNFQPLASNGTDREHFVSVIKQLLEIREGSIDIPPTVRQEEEVLLGKGDQLARRVKPGVYLEDLMTTVRYTLYQEVCKIQSIEGSKLQAVKDYVTVLAKYLPCRKPASTFLGKLDAYLSQTQAPLSGDVWLETLHKLESNGSYLPENTSYVACRGSKTYFRGYPCGLWVIFHTLTVNSVLEHGKDLNSMTVLQAMKGYITEIFGCKHCGENFKKETETMAQDVSNPVDSILYLWGVHNSVNQRLHEDLTEDPFYYKVQFPPRTLCPECYLDKSIGDDDRPNFNQEEVLTFLTKFYSRGQIVGENMLPGIADLYVPAQNSLLEINSKNSIAVIEEWRRSDKQRKEDMSLLAEIKSAKRADQSQTNERPVNFDRERIERLRRDELGSRYSAHAVGMTTGFSSLDLSMCVVFYVICTLILLMAYFHFTVHRKMKPICCCPNMV